MPHAMVCYASTNKLQEVQQHGGVLDSLQGQMVPCVLIVQP